MSLEVVRARIERLTKSLRRSDFPEAKRRKHRPMWRCGRCRRSDHLRPQCSIRDLRLWTNGAEVWIARSAEDASKLEGESDRTFCPDPIEPTPLSDWRLVCGENARIAFLAGAPLQREARRESEWILANDRGLLAFRGDLLACARTVPEPFPG